MKRACLAVLLTVVATACEKIRREAAEAVDTTTTTAPPDTVAASPNAPRVPGSRVLAVEGFLSPESVLYDSIQDVYFVANVQGAETAKDNNGFISRVKPDGAVENLRWVEGGRGVTLHAPKGMALHGDTLWVTDINVVRGFHARTGLPTDSISLADSNAVFLNDIAVSPTTGALYITDTGIRFDDVGNILHPGPDRIFRIAPDRAITVAIRGDSLAGPNGIALDPVGKRFIVVSFSGKSVLSWKPGDKTATSLARGAGGYDGVEMVKGKIVVSSWNDSSVSFVEGNQLIKLVSGVPGPAGIGYDSKRNRVLIPVMMANRVEVWQLP